MSELEKSSGSLGSSDMSDGSSLAESSGYFSSGSGPSGSGPSGSGPSGSGPSGSGPSGSGPSAGSGNSGMSGSSGLCAEQTQVCVKFTYQTDEPVFITLVGSLNAGWFSGNGMSASSTSTTITLEWNEGPGEWQCTADIEVTSNVTIFAHPPAIDRCNPVGAIFDTGTYEADGLPWIIEVMAFGSCEGSSSGSSSTSSSGCNCPPFVFNGIDYPAEFFGGTLTTGVLTSLYVPGTNSATIVTDTDWYTGISEPATSSAEGEISFGVACSSVVGIEIASGDSSTTPNYIAQVLAYIDGVPWPAPGTPIADMSDEAPGALMIDIPLTNDCSVITLVCTIARSGDDPDAIDGTCSVEAHILYVY